jgi:hypothetical protein
MVETVDSRLFARTDGVNGAAGFYLVIHTNVTVVVVVDDIERTMLTRSALNPSSGLGGSS